MKTSILRPTLLFVSAVLMYGCGNTPVEPTLSNENIGRECSIGATKPDDDGCNTCTCDENGWACTELGCVEAECTDGETKAADDGCNTCTCASGVWGGCTELGCVDGDAAAESPVQPAGECPAPQASAEMCAQVIVWSKSSDGKSCCQYATPCHAPKDWKQFPSEAECSR